MKEKHIRIRVEQCLALAKASNCPRRKFGAVLLDPTRNVVLMDGYNGGPRGGGELCGGATCLRDDLQVKPGTSLVVAVVIATPCARRSVRAASVRRNNSSLPDRPVIRLA